MLTAGMGDKRNRVFQHGQFWRFGNRKKQQFLPFCIRRVSGTGWRRDPTLYRVGDLASTVLPTLWPSSPKATA